MLKTGRCRRSADTSSEASASAEPSAGEHPFSTNGGGLGGRRRNCPFGTVHLPRAASPPSTPSSRPGRLRALRGHPCFLSALLPHSYQHPQPPGHLQWGRRHSEPLVTLPGPLLGLTRRGSEPTYLPSVAVGWGWAEASWGTEPGLEGLASQFEELGGSSWRFLSPSCESSGAQQVGAVGSETGFLLHL